MAMLNYGSSVEIRGISKNSRLVVLNRYKLLWNRQTMKKKKKKRKSKILENQNRDVRGSLVMY